MVLKGKKYFFYGKPLIFAFFQTGHANLPRAANRCGGEYIEVYNLLHVMLPGPMFLFAGEELGMRDARVKPTVGKTVRI